MYIVNYGIKHFLLLNFIFLIIKSKDMEVSMSKFVTLQLFIICNVYVYLQIKIYLNQFLAFGIIYLLFIASCFFLYNKYTLNNVIKWTLCFLLVYVFNIFAAFLYTVITYPFLKNEYVSFIGFRLNEVITACCLYKFKKSKKLSNGFNIIGNGNYLKEYLFLLFYLVVILSIISFLWFMFYDNKNFLDQIEFYWILSLFLLTLFLIIFIKREIANRYKNIAQEMTINNLSYEIKELEKENERLSKLSKISHKTNHEIDLLKDKLSALPNADILSELNTLSSKYRDSVNNLSDKGLLQSTKIAELDDVLLYMKKSCDKQNIIFMIRVNGSVNYMTEKYISVDMLKTLLSDHLKNSLISIENSENKYRSIIINIGEHGDCYGVSFFDTGVNFKINTLVNLGLKAITTHKKTGGTGFGMMSTFETLENTKASITIEEKKFREYDYTKSITILFDDLKEYRIKSYRNKQIELKNKENNIKFIK